MVAGHAEGDKAPTISYFSAATKTITIMKGARSNPRSNVRGSGGDAWMAGLFSANGW
jgi:hypothetical protein